MSEYQVLFILFTVSVLFVGVHIFYRRKDEMSKFFLLFCILTSAWSVHMYVLFDLKMSYEIKLWSVRVGNLNALYISWAWINFIYYFLGESGVDKWFRKAVFVACAPVGFFFWSTLFVPRLMHKCGYEYWPDPGVLFHIFAILFFITFTLSFVKLLEHFFDKQRTKYERNRAGYLIVASLVGFVSGSSSFFPVYYIPVPPQVYYGLPVFPFLLAYAIFHHGLFDMEEFVASAHRFKLMTMGMLSACLTHEIKNPMYALRGALETFHAKSASGGFRGRTDLEIASEVKTFCEKHMATLDRTTGIIARFTEYLRPSEKAAAGKCKSADVSRVIERVVEFLQYSGASKGVAVEIKVPQESCIARADDRELEEILLNLAMNACQALAGTGKLRFEIEKAQKSLHISVCDSGPGMSRDQLQQIFDPFYSRKPDAKGVGLGLYIAKLLTERNGGRIAVKSHPSRGTTFTVTFEVAK